MEPFIRKYTFSSFEEAITFIDCTALIFSRENHHPKITNFYNLVEFEYYTTSASNKVTELDHKIAKEVEKIYRKLTQRS